MMCEIKSVKEMESRSKEILRRRESDIADREEKLEAAKKAEATAQAAAEAAVVSGDKDAYHAAQMDIGWAKESIDMCTKRLHDLKEEALVSKEEYETKVAAVFADVNAKIAEEKAQIVALVGEMQKIAAADKAMRDRADAVLQEWQETIYRYADAKDKVYMKAYGEVSPHDKKEIKDNSVSEFVSIVLGLPVYSTISGK